MRGSAKTPAWWDEDGGFLHSRNTWAMHASASMWTVACGMCTVYPPSLKWILSTVNKIQLQRRKKNNLKLHMACENSDKIWVTPFMVALLSFNATCNDRSLEWFADAPFVKCSPIQQEILNVSQKAVTLHGIRPPFFVQGKMQQYSRDSLLYPAYRSLSNPLCLWTKRCGGTRMPG